MAELVGQSDETPQQRWERVCERREAFADLIDQMAKSQPRAYRKRIRDVSTFFRRDGSYDAAIVQPNVVAIAHPLLNVSGREALSDDQLAKAVSDGFSSLSFPQSNIERISQMMIYPALIVIAVCCMYLGFAFFLAPEFESMFKEFGIELPSVTSGLLGVARFVRNIGWLIGIVLIVFLLLSVWWLRSPGAFISRFEVLGKLFENERQTMAGLAFHAAQLRSVGLSAKQAFAVANFAAGQTSRAPDTSNDQPNAKATPRIALTPRYSLLEMALQQPANYANDRMLLEVAECYRRRVVTTSGWWIQWLLFGFQWLVYGCALLMVAVMFLPLISIVSGLTGSLL